MRISQTRKLVLVVFISSIISACANSPSNKTAETSPLPNLQKHLPTGDTSNKATLTLHCKLAHTFEHKVVGDGHCVSLIKACSGAPDTVHWRPGERVIESKPTPGTVIATFDNNHYPCLLYTSPSPRD